MQTLEAAQPSSFATTRQVASPLYAVGQNPHHARMRHIELDVRVLERFFEDVKQVNSQYLEYVPYMRFILAGKLELATRIRPEYQPAR